MALQVRYTIDLGKIDYNDRGRKINRVTIDVKLTDNRLSISGNIWNGNGSDIISGGQNLEEIGRLFPRNPRVQRIVSVWRRWHLNDMRAGTPEQETYLRQHPELTTYDARCEALTVANLNPHNGYRYGSQWLSETLPTNVIEQVRDRFAHTPIPDNSTDERN